MLRNLLKSILTISGIFLESLVTTQTPREVEVLIIQTQTVEMFDRFLPQPQAWVGAKAQMLRLLILVDPTATHNRTRLPISVSGNRQSPKTKTRTRIRKEPDSGLLIWCNHEAMEVISKTKLWAEKWECPVSKVLRKWAILRRNICLKNWSTHMKAGAKRT